MASLVLLKPEIVTHPVLLKCVVIELIDAGLVISGAKRLKLSRQEADKLYGVHKGKFFYPRLLRHVSSGPVMALRVEGDVRSVLGNSKLWPMPREEDQSLRQRYAISDVRNVAHNSDPENAEYELSLFEPLHKVNGLDLLDNQELYDFKMPETKQM